MKGMSASRPNGASVATCIDKYPLYLKVADRLEARIARRPAGSLLSSENELAREYSVSRLTARAVLEELERRYLVQRSQGRGTFVAGRLDYVIGPGTPPSFSQKVRLAGGTPHTETEVLKVRRAPAAVRDALELSAGARTLFLARRRFVDGKLAAYAETWLDERLVPGLETKLGRAESLGGVLERAYGLEPYSSAQRAEFVIAPASIGPKIGQDGRPMVFRLEGTVRSGRLKRAIECTTSYLRADTFRVVFQMGTPA
jgi:DNA-binding GntR family transcriptional regulator